MSARCGDRVAGFLLGPGVGMPHIPTSFMRRPWERGNCLGGIANSGVDEFLSYKLDLGLIRAKPCARSRSRVFDRL